jgi:hypothetical protein
MLAFVKNLYGGVKRDFANGLGSKIGMRQQRLRSTQQQQAVITRQLLVYVF